MGLFFCFRGANIGTVLSPPSYSKMRSRDDLLFFFVGKVFSLVKPAVVSRPVIVGPILYYVLRRRVTKRSNASSSKGRDISPLLALLLSEFFSRPHPSFPLSLSSKHAILIRGKSGRARGPFTTAGGQGGKKQFSKAKGSCERKKVSHSNVCTFPLN